MRQIWSLDGEWLFVKDPLQIGEREAWHEKQWNQDAMKVKVPHIWQREGGDLVGYNGVAWYRREVELTGWSGQRQHYVCFGAVDYRCTVWWNGEWIGEHEGGFTPFELRIPPGLIRDCNTVTVSVFDPKDNAEIPIGKQGSWYTRVSGIWQSVRIEERSAAHIRSAMITPDTDSMKLDVRVELTSDAPGDLKLQYTIRPHACGDADTFEASSYEGILEVPTVQPGERREVDLQVSATDMKLWSPAQPHLYEIELILVDHLTETDQYVTTFGMRKVEQKDGRIYVNDQPVYIRGALDQAFYPDTIYTAADEAYIRREIALAKQMGFNLLRKHIKVETPEYLYWADRLGMLIWAEPPNYVKWTASARERFVAELRAMLKRDYNHPSIIIWSIYNEEWGLEWDLEFDPEKQRHVAELVDTVRAWDPTRLICDNSGWTHIKTDINDHHRYFACPDQLDEWRKDLDEFVIGDPDANFVKPYRSQGEPIIVSEFGVWGLPDVERLKTFYDGNEPWWFVNQGEETHQDDYKKPTTAMENMNKFGLDRTFGGFERLAVHSQRRMFRAVKSLVEEMRKRPAIGGYVVTEFTDIEWETNGWLDFLRQPKEGFDRLADFNGAACVFAEIAAANVWSGETVAWDLVLTNDDLEPHSGVVRWRLAESGLAGEIAAECSGSWNRLPQALAFAVPETATAAFERLELEWHSEGKLIARNEYELTITPKAQCLLQAEDTTSITVHRMSPAFADKLQRHGWQIASGLSLDKVAVTDCLDKEIETFARQGGRVLFLAEKGDKLSASGPFTFRELPPGESWPRASSLNYVDPDFFRGIPLHREMGWEAGGLYPDYVLPFADYKKVGVKRTVNMFGNPGIAEAGEVIAGYFQGWLGQNGGSIVRHPLGKGAVTVVTWKLLDLYGVDPIASLLLHRLIDIAMKEND
ncbi:glycoside hydrolase family 2 protein [Paenibacillus allorhizosphaerae]|uniref:Beta-galactosidase n=1 Tax=Paenibacillus allorhizosphaerae TaxID=2849866 RepID=A0ABM8VSZ2_9BACL|nr:sugar-binding domain-containing protein [Paenibacillus allorhizosphaerae]CAG7657010.1 Beta-galactosidase [Paenibacillus allorhizosphaerae]